MTQNRYYSNIATVTTLATPGGLNATQTDLQCTATTGFPGTFPFVLRYEPDTDNEEAVLVTSGAGTSVTPYQVTRGYDGTQHIPHGPGVQIKHGFVQVDFAEPQQHLNLSGSSSAAHGLPASAWLGGSLQLLQTVNLASSTFISLPSIPTTFSKLVIDLAVTSNDTGGNGFSNIQLQFNGDTANDYSFQNIAMVNNTTVAGSSSAAVAVGYAGFATNGGVNPLIGEGVGQSIIEIPFYSVANLAKHFVFRSHASSGVGSPNNFFYGSGGGTWATGAGTTPAITSIKLFPSASPFTFAAGSSAKLYGIL